MVDIDIIIHRPYGTLSICTDEMAKGYKVSLVKEGELSAQRGTFGYWLVRYHDWHFSNVDGSRGVWKLWKSRAKYLTSLLDNILVEMDILKNDYTLRKAANGSNN